VGRRYRGDFSDRRERLSRGECRRDRALERDAADSPYPGQTVRQFLLWSLDRLRDHVPPRELDLSDRLDDEAIAFSYLCLCDEYDAGELTVEW
jgi:hypothetical protein